MERKMKKEVIEEPVKDPQKNNRKENIFRLEEIKIEEMAIDGICGVY